MFDIDKFVEDVKKVSEKKNCVIVAVSEGAKIDKDTYVCEALSKGETDAFGHKHLSGTARVLADTINRSVSASRRARLSSVSCALRSAQRVGDGYRGVAHDWRPCGRRSCKRQHGRDGFTLSASRTHRTRFRLQAWILLRLRTWKRLPREWINEEGNNVTQEAIDYMLPLIQGEAPIFMENGLPTHAVLKK